MCGTQEPMGSGVPGGTHPNLKNMGSGGFRVPGKLGQSGFRVGTQKVRVFFLCRPLIQSTLTKFLRRWLWSTRWSSNMDLMLKDFSWVPWDRRWYGILRYYSIVVLFGMKLAQFPASRFENTRPSKSNALSQKITKITYETHPIFKETIF